MFYCWIYIGMSDTFITGGTNFQELQRNFIRQEY